MPGDQQNKVLPDSYIQDMVFALWYVVVLCEPMLCLPDRITVGQRHGVWFSFAA